MIIDCISDLHGEYPVLEGGDLLIVAGDLTTNNSVEQYELFFDWLHKQKYTKKIVIGGNHDNALMKISDRTSNPPIVVEYMHHENCIYLCDSGTEFESLKIWGSPWTKTFDGINPHCMAFTVETEHELADKWKLIPEDTDILITHCPPYGILDAVYRGRQPEYCGSISLRNHMLSRSDKDRLHVFGHIHEQGGKMVNFVCTTFVNASVMNEDYEHVNKSVRIVFGDPPKEKITVEIEVENLVDKDNE